MSNENEYITMTDDDVRLPLRERLSRREPDIDQTEPGAGPAPGAQQPAAWSEAADAIENLMRKYCADHALIFDDDYDRIFSIILDQNPNLKQRYAVGNVESEGDDE